jgi:Mycotoxin biosynthesis protein UstYa
LQLDHIPVWLTDSNATQRLHLGKGTSSVPNFEATNKRTDHCIDILRQALQCHGDVGVVTNSWVDGFESAYPDFNVWHKCRKFDALLDWTGRHAVDAEPTLPPGVHPLAKPPCENAARDAVCP